MMCQSTEYSVNVLHIVSTASVYQINIDVSYLGSCVFKHLEWIIFTYSCVNLSIKDTFDLESVNDA